ncbi:hypothetical protein PL78_06115 [Yersinia entomophaga]|uniref:Uncharacterized protein n=1 Tax=Yersinia entomophaga TaxID=935293 RepID=A0ABN4PW06_YERET|nr:hypothetical protein [Yersinia entomophaga]ANI29415.1 hypothetical protein PL78_06115 [Yersinia entomophaga]OWF88269.1 hypothetical protein B4914_07840 [Yersinia entomophaga]
MVGKLIGNTDYLNIGLGLASEKNRVFGMDKKGQCVTFGRFSAYLHPHQVKRFLVEAQKTEYGVNIKGTKITYNDVIRQAKNLSHNEYEIGGVFDKISNGHRLKSQLIT